MPASGRIYLNDSGGARNIAQWGGVNLMQTSFQIAGQRRLHVAN